MAEIIVSAEEPRPIGKKCGAPLAAKEWFRRVVYGGKGDNLPLLSIRRRLQQVLRSEAGRNTILKLDIAGQGATNAILKSWQVDPIRENFLHADFYRIAMDVAIRVNVPIAITGEARGVKVDGGILELIYARRSKSNVFRVTFRSALKSTSRILD